MRLQEIHKYITIALGAATAVLSIILWAVLSDRGDLEESLVRSNEKIESLEASKDSLYVVIAHEVGYRSALQERIDTLVQTQGQNQKKIDEIRDPNRRRPIGADDLRRAILRSVRK